MDRLEIPGWREVAAGDVAFFSEKLENGTLQEYIDIKFVGPFGESILHWALLQGQEEIAILLMNEFPWLIHGTYANEPFIGEGTMHIAVANSMTKAIQEMLEICQCYEMKRLEYKAQGDYMQRQQQHISVNKVSEEDLHCWMYPLNTQVVTGRFFSQGSTGRQVYYGQHNLAFAVSRGNEEAVELMVQHRARVDIRDRNENSIIHLCVLFGNRHIFDQIVRLGKEEEKRGGKFKYKGVDRLEKETDSFEEWMTLHRNEQRYTALQAAVTWNKMDMFEKMLTYKRKAGWRWGPLAMFRYPLKEIDTHGLENPNSVLEVIVSEGRRHFLDIAVIRDIFAEKWDQYGKYMFRFELFMYMFWICTLSVSAYSIDFRQFDNDDAENPVEKLDIPITIFWLKVLTAVVSVLFLLVEAFEFKDLWVEHGTHGGLRIYFAIKSRKNTVHDKSGLLESHGSTISICGVFKIIVWLRNIITIIALACVWVASKSALDVAFVFYLFAIILAFIGLLEYFQLQKHAGRFVIMVLKILIRDVSVFSLVWLVILLGFAISFTLIREDKDFGKGLFFMLETSLSFGDIATQNFHDTKLCTAMGMIIYVLFIVFSVVLLLNLLIAVMAETTQAIGQQATNRLNYVEQWASTVLKMERRVPACWYKRTGQRSSADKHIFERKLTSLETVFKNDAKEKNLDVAYYVDAVENIENSIMNMGGSPTRSRRESYFANEAADKLARMRKRAASLSYDKFRAAHSWKIGITDRDKDGDLKVPDSLESDSCEDYKDEVQMRSKQGTQKIMESGQKVSVFPL